MEFTITEEELRQLVATGKKGIRSDFLEAEHEALWDIVSSLEGLLASKPRSRPAKAARPGDKPAGKAKA